MIERVDLDASRSEAAMVFVLERFTHNALALLAVTTLLFFMFRLMPSTPLAAFINENSERRPAAGHAGAVRPR